MNRLAIIIVGILLVVFGAGMIAIDTFASVARGAEHYLSLTAATNDARRFASGSTELQWRQQVVIIAAALVIGLLAIWWLLRGLAFGYRRPGREAIMHNGDTTHTEVTAKAVRGLVDGASRMAGALDSSTSIRPHSSSSGYDVRCVVTAQRGSNLAVLARAVREGIGVELQQQGVPNSYVDVVVDSITQRKQVVR